VANYQAQLDRNRNDDEIGKTKYFLRNSKENRGQLLAEISELTAANRRLQDIVDHLNSDIKLQTDKYKENEKNFKEKITTLESQLKRTQTEQFTKLREDNKHLIAENADLKKNSEKLLERNRVLGLNLDKIMRDEELLKNSLMKEFEDVQIIKAQLDNEQKSIELER